MRQILTLMLALGLVAGAAASARADSPDATDTTTQTYAKFIDGAQSHPGLFTVWRKDGKVYLELRKDQLDTDFIQSAVPVNGLGGFGIYPGSFDYAPARLIRFSRTDDKVYITWPNTNFTAPAGTPISQAIDQTTAASNVGVAKIEAEDSATGDIVIAADAFLGDVIDLSDSLKATLGTTPENSYHLDTDTASFGPTKAFPQNVLIEVRQNWVTDVPDVVDNVPDPRNIEFRIDYNLVAPPNDGYMPRIADDRVGFFSNVTLDFGSDRTDSRQLHYIIRWNFKPQDPTKPSPATHPMVFYLSSAIPDIYRPALRDGIMEWNNAFARVGILDAIQVKDQPNDPSFDPDDVRNNMLTWLTESNGGGFAEAQLMIDPRTGEEFHTGVLFDADLMYFNHIQWRDFANPVGPSALRGFGPTEADYAEGMREHAAFGAEALSLLGRSSSYSQNQFDYDFLKNIALHESGHDMGLQHNFIGSEAYTDKELQSKAFTSRYGIATSVMEYAPMNIWPNGTPQGEYWQIVLGPYDYYAIHYGYAAIPSATTPQAEVPTLQAWASKWSDPMYRFASDEDVSWFNGHAIDPRVEQFDLSNDTLGWLSTQMTLSQSLLHSLDRRMPGPGQSYQRALDSFSDVFGLYGFDALMADHYVAGQYLSRSHLSDPGSTIPLTATPRSEEVRAWGVLDRYLFSDDAWKFSPNTLNRMTYAEWSPWQGAAWAYNPPPRHDLPVIDIVGGWQRAALAQVFQPEVLQRLDALSVTGQRGQTMSTSDLFDWAQRSVFGDLSSGNITALPAIRRNLQAAYAGMLIHMAIAPDPGTPSGAQALARAKLMDLASTLRHVQLAKSADEETMAHLQLLQTRVAQALDAQVVMPAR